jgi:dephospho-CoA kinase
MAKISTEMRGDNGLGVTRIAVDEAIKKKHLVVFLEGLRSWPEIKYIKSKANCAVIAIIAPRSLRLKRVELRGRVDDSPLLFDEKDKREFNYGVATCIALADEHIVNAGTMEDAYLQLDKIIKGALS